MVKAVLTDQERETRIKELGDEIVTQHTQGREDKSFFALMEMEELIKGRSPEQVAKMERERGLM